MKNPRSFRDRSARSAYEPEDAATERASDTNTIYGLIPVLEMLRTGGKQLEQITISEAARHERLRELIELAKQARVPVHRVPRSAIDRLLPGITHQGVVARAAAAKYRDADDLLDQLASQVNTC